ncbi:unnamed protein product [Protopolystoma xenopodis]|uniref:Uncharacterized protein n=1 Tax=Protopolystoma xenopodis TaxID=117903 RepID=A0A448WUV3_9PLAT|nr:unnamed protein product [Protopolystoma xenopodis]
MSLSSKMPGHQTIQSTLSPLQVMLDGTGLGVPGPYRTPPGNSAGNRFVPPPASGQIQQTPVNSRAIFDIILP